MKDTKKRVLVAFYAVMKSGGHVTSSDLASACNVSTRTIKNDLEELMKFGETAGCLIHVKKGYGISLEIIDNEKFKEIKNLLEIQFASIDHRQSLVKMRLSQLARLLIIQNNFIKIDELADLMYLSRGSIKQELKELRMFFDSFHIELISKPGSGVYAKGTELSKRLCMIELYEIHYPNAVSNIECVEFTDYFQSNPAEKNLIRQIFLAEVRKSDNAVLDILGNRMVNYLILVRNRIKKESLIEVGSMYKNILKSFREYHLAKNIIGSLQSLDGYDLSDDEILGLEILLLNWSDIHIDDNLESLYPIFYAEAKELTSSMFELIHKKEKINFFEVENSESEMIAGIIPIVSQVFFNCSHYSITGKHIDDNGIRNSPLAIRLAQESVKMIEEKFDCRITDHDINILAVRYYSFLDRVNYSYEKRKLIVFCRNGFEGARILKDKILRRYNPKWFDKIDIYEFYEVRAINQSEYDYVIMDYDEYSYHYDLPFIYMTQIPTETQMNNLYNEVILSGFNLQVLYNRSGLSNAKYYNDFFYETKKSFASFLSYKLCTDMENIKRLKRFIEKYTDIHVHNNVLTLFIPQGVLESNTFEIYKLEKKMIWNKKNIEYIVVVSINYDGSLELSRLIERATSILTRSPKIIQTLITHENPQVYFLELLVRDIKTG